jgi:Mg-chelatase subunit ChlI
VKTLARTITGTFKRIQFTPDLVPADLIGTRIYNQKTGEFNTSLGPVFCNLLLADEINRAPAKVQSALLEVMQERQVTIAGRRTRSPSRSRDGDANPIETEGTYPLPEAQVDRFMMKVLVGYPSEEEEFVIVERVTGVEQDVASVATTDELARLQRECRMGYVDPSLIQYAVRLVAATRNPGAFRHQGHGALSHLRREPARDDPPDRGCARARLSARTRVRAPRGCVRSRARRPAAPAVALVRGALRCAHRRCADRPDHAARAQAGEAARHPCPNRRQAEVQRLKRFLRRLEWTVVRRLDGVLHGDYRTLFRGYGLDFADLREYAYGDDVRHIDWNVTARLQTPYVREYYEEREVAAWFLLDLSASVDFGSRG